MLKIAFVLSKMYLNENKAQYSSLIFSLPGIRMELDVGLNICGKVMRAYINCVPIIMLNAASGGK